MPSAQQFWPRSWCLIHVMADLARSQIRFGIAPRRETRQLNSRIATAQPSAYAFTLVMRALVLFVLVGLASISTAHAHQPEAFSPVSVQASENVSLNACCHAPDQGAQHADCALSMCCSLSALAGIGGQDTPPATASTRPLIGPMGFAGRSHPPILHPPIAT